VEGMNFMNINTLLEQKNMSKYRLSKLSGVPHTTVLDICNGKTAITKCTSETLYKLSKVLDVSMEVLISDSLKKRSSFENFKSTICHMINDMTDIDFLIHILESDEIRRLYDLQWYPECLYLLAMVDYLSRINNFPLCDEYNDLRNARLEKIIYPLGILTMSIICKTDEYKTQSLKTAIPEFLRHNIVESEIRNVC